MENNRHYAQKFIAIFLTFAMCCSLATVAFAVSLNTNTSNSALLSSYKKQNLIVDNSFSSSSPSLYTVETNSMTMNVSTSTPGLVNLISSNADSSFSMSTLPDNAIFSFVDENIVGFTSNDNSWESLIIAQEETSKQITILNNDTAPLTYEYNFDLPSGAYMDYVRHEKTGEILNGIVNIYNSDGARMGAINAPYVVDADGIELESHFIINGNLAKQVIITTPSTVYPISSTIWIAPISTLVTYADTTTIFKYFTSPTILWNRDGEGKHSLSLGGRTWDVETRHIHEQPAWQAVKACYSSISTIWTNEESLYDQYMCHSNLAQRKDPWNLEPWRPTTLFVTLELCLCNYPDCWWD